MKQLEYTPRSLHVETTDEALVIRPEGPCDTECARALDGIVKQLNRSSRTSVILDATDVKYIDTPGFRWITDQFRKVQDLGGQLVVVGLKGSAERAFKLLQLDRFIPSTATVEAAIARIRRGDKS